MSKPSPARYRTKNWSSYTASLCRRESLLIWLDKDMTWLAPPDGRPGRPAVFSDAAIQFCLTIKVLFKLPLRQTTGMVASLLKMAGLDWAVTEVIFADVNAHLEGNGITLRSGTLVDATIIDAPSPTKNKAKARDPETSSTKKGNGRYLA